MTASPANSNVEPPKRMMIAAIFQRTRPQARSNPRRIAATLGPTNPIWWLIFLEGALEKVRDLVAAFFRVVDSHLSGLIRTFLDVSAGISYPAAEEAKGPL